jgi:iron complex outermembrane receptor protein
MGTTGGVQQEIAGRGFAFSSSNTFKNGVRYNNAALPEMSALEKVEVMKGSAAILFGNVAAGGVINLVTKKPTFTQGGEVTARFDSYDFYKPSIDVYGVLNEKKNAAYRINTVYEKARSFRKEVKSERMYINPSFAFKLSRKTDLLVEGDYLQDKRTSDFGVGAINYELIDIPRETFLGAKWSYYQVEQKSASATLIHRFNHNWQLRSVTSSQFFNNDLFGTARPNSNNRFIRANGNWVRGLQRTKIDEQYYITQLDLTGKFNTGSLKHQVLLGGDADQYETTTVAYNNLDKYDSINVFDLALYKQRNDIPELLEKTTTTSPIKRAGLYVQDLITLTPKIKVLAGVRGSYLETTSRVLTHSTGSMAITRQYDYATTPRLGLVLQPNRKLSLFGSYANSFAPNTGVDIEGKALKPSFMTQYEAGFKSNLFREVLSANVTAYQIVNSNLAQTSLANGNTNTNIKELAGEVTSKGVEVDVMSKSLCGFMIMAGYSYNETRYTRSNT